MNISIQTAHDSPEELAIKNTLEEILKTHTFPIYTESIVIDSDARSHSHPVLTISTKRTDWRCILKTIVHEQMHWLHNGDDRWDRAREYFKEKHPTPPVEFANNPPRSFWTHIIVCWNTENHLRVLMSPTDLEFVNGVCPDYVETMKLIRDNFETIGKELQSFDLISKL